MAAGLGFKTFTTGEVLTAADTNGYLMQGILVFASSAARAAAITSPQEGQYSYLKDTNALEYYDGAAWVGAPVGDITAVTAGTGISGGGSSGDVTITNSMATAIDAKGDLIAGTADNTFSRLAVGTNGQLLTADSTTATGLKWSTVSSSPTFVGASAYNANFSQAFTSGTAVTIAFPNEDFDTNSFHDNSTNNSRLTVPSGYAGKYLISTNIDLNGVSAYYICAIRQFNSSGSSLATNGLNRQFAQNAGGNNFAGGTQAWIANASAGDYFTVTWQLGQDGTLSSNYARFAITYLGA